MIINNSEKRKYNIFDIFVFILITTLSFGGIGGAFAPVRIIVLLLSLYLCGKLNHRDYKYVKPIKILFVTCIIWCVFSLLWSYDKAEGIQSIIYYIIHFFLFIEIIVFSKNAVNPFKTITLGWITAFSLTAIIALWEISTDSHLSISKFGSGMSMNMGDGNIVYHPYASATFTNYNTYVTFVCYCLPFIFKYITDIIKINFKLIFAIMILIAAIYILITNASRGGTISLVLMLIVFISSYKSIFLKLCISLCIIGFILYVGDDFLIFVEHRFSEKTNINEEGRFDLWLSGLSILKDTLFLGTGIGGTINAMKFHTNMNIHVMHNFFVEIIVELGLLMSLIIYYYIYSLFRDCLLMKNSATKLSLRCAIVASPFYFIVNSTYLLFPITFAFFASLYVFCYYETKIKI